MALVRASRTTSETTDPAATAQVAGGHLHVELGRLAHGPRLQRQPAQDGGDVVGVVLGRVSARQPEHLAQVVGGEPSLAPDPLGGLLHGR